MERCLAALDDMTQCIAPTPSRFTPHIPSLRQWLIYSAGSYNNLCSTYFKPFPRVVTHVGQPILAAAGFLRLVLVQGFWRIWTRHAGRVRHGLGRPPAAGPIYRSSSRIRGPRGSTIGVTREDSRNRAARRRHAHTRQVRAIPATVRGHTRIAWHGGRAGGKNLHKSQAWRGAQRTLLALVREIVAARSHTQ
jgi:hypothetical protein